MKTVLAAGVCLIVTLKGLAQGQPCAPGMDLIYCNGDKVGIGTTTPNSTLTVVGSGFTGIVAGKRNDAASISGLFGLDSNSGGVYMQNSNGDFILYNGATIGFAAGNERLRITSGGDVGIGTVIPRALLDLSSTTQLHERLRFSGQEFYQAGNTSTDGPTFVLGVNRTGNRQLFLADSTATTVNNSNTLIRFGVGGTATPDISGLATDLSTKNLTLQVNGGNVGIGRQPDSGFALDVAGTVRATNVLANFQDVAEWVPASEQMTPGTVVVVSDDAKNTVAPSNAAYDTRVAGVVSLAPGVLLGVESSSKAKIATTGRVKVRADASRVPIHLGDLLVTSDTPGTAMKSEPLDLGGVKIHRPGTLIGKALEPLDKGQGEILVLLSLQ
jgi:hypothetical protein